MLAVMVVTFEVSMGSLSSMLMTNDGSVVVTVAVFSHGCTVVLIEGAGLAAFTAADGLAGPVATTGFPVHSASGPFWIR